ncbi:hypothetical protein Bca52824_026648 [Brassica carinata]|uniref:Uncharacterized protein n=1 Tax=Brassica carinata TaxID=52824 RepID=A0A8X7V848_BRACI|nr:hypothetical protein Bca52824_026648 [Brassica carinata]
MGYFYRLERHDEGLALIKRAVDAGFERALYIYAMTRKIFRQDEEYFSRFTRESVARIGMSNGFIGTLRTPRLKTCVTAASGLKRLLFFYVTLSPPPIFRTFLLGSEVFVMGLLAYLVYTL